MITDDVKTAQNQVKLQIELNKLKHYKSSTKKGHLKISTCKIG